MALLGDLVGRRVDRQTVSTHPLVMGTGRVGIEIELEGARQLDLASWNSIGDGSLRNHGVEYVMRQPLGGADLYRAVCEVDTALTRINPDASWRCSTHVHVDIRDMTVPQFKKLLLLYIVYERVLFECSGMHRYQNNFCPAYGFAQEMIMRLSSVWHLEEEAFVNAINFRRRGGDRDKYNSLNLLPMFTQGSIEFRGSEPKFKKGKLLRLANRLLSLKEFAMSHVGSEQSLVSFAMESHPSAVLQKSLPKKFPYDPELIEEGLKLAEDVMNLHNFRPEVPMVELRSGRRSYWQEHFGRECPDPLEMPCDELQRLVREAGVWAGDVVTASGFDTLVTYCNENDLPL